MVVLSMNDAPMTLGYISIEVSQHSFHSWIGCKSESIGPVGLVYRLLLSGMDSM